MAALLADHWVVQSAVQRAAPSAVRRAAQSGS
jgi:hypothetical protein